MCGGMLHKNQVNFKHSFVLDINMIMSRNRLCMSVLVCVCMHKGGREERVYLSLEERWKTRTMDLWEFKMMIGCTYWFVHKGIADNDNRKTN